MLKQQIFGDVISEYNYSKMCTLPKDNKVVCWQIVYTHEYMYFKSPSHIQLPWLLSQCALYMSLYYWSSAFRECWGQLKWTWPDWCEHLFTDTFTHLSHRPHTHNWMIPLKTQNPSSSKCKELISIRILLRRTHTSSLVHTADSWSCSFKLFYVHVCAFAWHFVAADST